MTAPGPRYLLMSDDFGLSPGVSDGIAELARAGRLSGASAMVNMPGWRDGLPRSPGLHDHLSFGLHLNLTLGSPLGPMPAHAPAGRFPAVSAWIARALTGRIAAEEVGAEIDRQLDCFEAAAGAPPDHVDGHHHVHILPGIREALVRALARRFPGGRLPLVRVPGDRLGRILARRGPIAKAAGVALLSGGARASFRRAGAPVNDGFAGFSTFRRDVPFAAELAGFERARGPVHLVMCHPGHADPALAGLDPVSGRRSDELAALAADPTLPDRIHHPSRFRDDRRRIDWAAALAS